MEGTYGVYLGKELCGKVQVLRQGLYYRFICRCQLSGNVMCRLRVSCGDQQQTLGILAPEGEGFGLDTRLPVKRIGEGAVEFTIVPKCDLPEGQFVPVYPEEPFAYLNRLKDCYLAYREGQVGVVIQ